MRLVSLRYRGRSAPEISVVFVGMRRYLSVLFPFFLRQTLTAYGASTKPLVPESPLYEHANISLVPASDGIYIFFATEATVGGELRRPGWEERKTPAFNKIFLKCRPPVYQGHWYSSSELSVYQVPGMLLLLYTYHIFRVISTPRCCPTFTNST